MPVAPAPLFTFRMIPLIHAELARRGIDGAALLRQAKLPELAQRGEITAPLPRIQRFVSLASARLGDDLFGITLAQRNPAGSYGVAEFLVRSAPDLEVALQMVSKAAALVNPSLQFSYEADATEGRLHLAVAGQRDVLGCHLNEYTFSYILRQLASVIDGGLGPSRMWFAHVRTNNGNAIAEHFGCNVTFQARGCGLAVERSRLARAPRTADPALFAFLLAQARSQLGQLASNDIISQVMRVIEIRLTCGDVGAAAVATAMATTVRSLQRHLGEAGTSYREVLEHVRRRRLEELYRGGVSDAEAARELGFADAKSMRRALKLRA